MSIHEWWKVVHFTIPEWKQNIKVTKTIPIPPQAWSSSGTSTALHSTCQTHSCSYRSITSLVKCLSCSFFIYNPRETFHDSSEMLGGSRRSRIRHPSFLLYSFLAQVEPSYVLCLLLQFPEFKAVTPQQDSWQMFKKCNNWCASLYVHVNKYREGHGHAFWDHDSSLI